MAVPTPKPIDVKAGLATGNTVKTLANSSVNKLRRVASTPVSKGGHIKLVTSTVHKAPVTNIGRPCYQGSDEGYHPVASFSHVIVSFQTRQHPCGRWMYHQPCMLVHMRGPKHGWHEDESKLASIGGTIKMHTAGKYASGRRHLILAKDDDPEDFEDGRHDLFLTRGRALIQWHLHDWTQLYLTNEAITDLAWLDDTEFRKSYYGTDHHFCVVTCVAGMPALEGVCPTGRNRYVTQGGLQQSRWSDMIANQYMFPCADGTHAWCPVVNLTDLNSQKLMPMDRAVARHVFARCAEVYGSNWDRTFGCCSRDCAIKPILPCWGDESLPDTIRPVGEIFTRQKPLHEQAASAANAPAVVADPMQAQMQLFQARQEVAQQTELSKKWLTNFGVALRDLNAPEWGPNKDQPLDAVEFKEMLEYRKLQLPSYHKKCTATTVVSNGWLATQRPDGRFFDPMNLEPHPNFPDRFQQRLNDPKLTKEERIGQEWYRNLESGAVTNKPLSYFPPDMVWSRWNHEVENVLFEFMNGFAAAGLVLLIFSTFL